MGRLKLGRGGEMTEPLRSKTTMDLDFHVLRRPDRFTRLRRSYYSFRTVMNCMSCNITVQEDSKATTVKE